MESVLTVCGVRLESRLNMMRHWSKQTQIKAEKWIWTESVLCLRMTTGWMRRVKTRPTMQHSNRTFNRHVLFTFWKPTSRHLWALDDVGFVYYVTAVMGSFLLFLSPLNSFSFPSASSSSDGDEASLVTADWLRHHTATLPPGHTPLPVEFSVTTKT